MRQAKIRQGQSDRPRSLPRQPHPALSGKSEKWAIFKTISPLFGNAAMVSERYHCRIANGGGFTGEAENPVFAVFRGFPPSPGRRTKGTFRFSGEK